MKKTDVTKKSSTSKIKKARKIPVKELTEKDLKGTAGGLVVSGYIPLI